MLVVDRRPIRFYLLFNETIQIGTTLNIFSIANLNAIYFKNL